MVSFQSSKKSEEANEANNESDNVPDKSLETGGDAFRKRVEHTRDAFTAAPV